MAKQVKINEQIVSEDELKKKKKEIEEMPNAQLVEVKKNEYKVRMRD